MPDYKTGKVYKIVDLNENLVYVGSTTKTLSQRMSGHRYEYTKRRERIDSSVFQIFDKYGIENCKILLIELFPCTCKDELTSREGHFIKHLICVNKNIAGRTQQEYRDTHKTEKKKWRSDNKDNIKEYNKQYRAKNKDQINENQLKYRLKKKLENQPLAIVDTPLPPTTSGIVLL